MHRNLVVMMAENTLIYLGTGQISNLKSQISNKLQISRFKKIKTQKYLHRKYLTCLGDFVMSLWLVFLYLMVGYWFFGAYLLFGACDLGFPNKTYDLCSYSLEFGI